LFGLIRTRFGVSKGKIGQSAVFFQAFLPVGGSDHVKTLVLDWRCGRFQGIFMPAHAILLLHRKTKLLSTDQPVPKIRRLTMKRVRSTFPIVLFFSLFCINASAQVEQVVSFVVTDDEILVESLDAWFATKDSNYGQTATLVSVVANGSDPSTHYLVLNYPNFAGYQAAIDGVEKSINFAKLERYVSKIATTNGESIYTQNLDNGKSEKNGDFMYVASVNLTGSDSEYVAAVKELMSSVIGKKAPGRYKMVENRAGGDSDYLVIFSAPSFAALNDYLDSHSGNKDWEIFLSKVSKISTHTGSSFLRVVKVWK
jgi:hypothetical protein